MCKLNSNQGKQENFYKLLVWDVPEGHNSVRWVKTGPEEKCTEEAGLLRGENTGRQKWHAPAEQKVNPKWG